jgi:hypothetical protein
MVFRILVAIGAGCAAALLFAVSAQTSPLAMILAYLAPLPIMIVTLGWGVGAGAVAAAISIVALGLLAEPLSGVMFAASVACPAWGLAAFAIAPLGHLFAAAARPGRTAQPSVGAIVILAAAIGMLGAAIVLTAAIVIYGGYGEAAKKISTALTALAGDAFEGGPEGASAREFAETLVRFGPAAIAASTLIMLCVNLYAAARSTQLSHRLRRPWPDLPTSLSLPWPLGLLLIACAAGAYALPLPASQYLSIGAAGLGAAFALQGLAVAHALSRGLKMRPVMLVALYACCIFRAKFTLPVLAALGLVDAFIKLRSRSAFLPAPNPTAHK